MQLFKSRVATQRFLTTHAAIYNNIYTQQHLIRRSLLRHLRSEAASAWTAATAGHEKFNLEGFCGLRELT